MDAAAGVGDGTVSGRQPKPGALSFGPGGVAAAILEGLGVHVEQIRAASHKLFGPPAEAVRDDIPPLSAEAICALDAAAHNAAANAGTVTPQEVSTEHLLGVLALDPGSRARRVLNELHVNIAAIKRQLQCHISVNPIRPARWWKRRHAATGSCSFCGQTRDPGQLVNGPGVTICRACIALAADTLTTRYPGGCAGTVPNDTVGGRHMMLG